MTVALSLSQVRSLRLQNQLLADADRASSAADVIRKLCALQSQEWASAQLAIAARGQGISTEDVKRAREEDRSFLLSWSLRGTLHLMAAEDIGWQLALFAERAIRQTNRRYQQLGLSESIREKALDEINDILSKHGALARPQLAEQLEARGIPVAGQAIHHLVRFAALRGLICLGPEIEGKLTFVLLAEWLPQLDLTDFSDDLLPMIARRYLSAYGPATSADLSRWAGLSAGQCKSAFDAILSDCQEVEIAAARQRRKGLPAPSAQDITKSFRSRGRCFVKKEGKALMPASQLIAPCDQKPVIRFLPRYDNYLLAYHSRDFMVAPAYAKQVHPGGGLIRTCVIIDGEAKATWRLERKGNGTRLIVVPYEKLAGALLPALEEEATILGQFLGQAIDLRIDAD